MNALESLCPGSRLLREKSMQKEVLKWSLDDVQNEHLLTDQLCDLPLKFDSVESYLDSFRCYLLEETRSMLQQSLATLRLSRAPWICIEKVRVVGKPPLLTCAFKAAGNRLQLKLNDVVLISTSSDTANLQRSGECTLAVLTRKRAGCWSSQVYVPKESQLFAGMRRAWYVISLDSLVPALRVWNALCQGKVNFPMFKVISGQHDHIESRLYELKHIQSRFPSWCNLNESQIRAVAAVLGNLTNDTPLVKLIQGPPGTGKTSMLVVLLYILCTSKKRVLMCAPTNAAISEVATRVLKCLDQDKIKDSLIRSGDVVLLGNEEKLQVKGSRLSGIYISGRVRRVTKSDWRSQIQLVSNFLMSAERMFEEVKKAEFSSFLKFLVEKLKDYGYRMIRSLERICNDLPKDIAMRIEGIVSAIRNMLTNAIDRMQGNVADAEARNWLKNLQMRGKMNYEPGSVNEGLDRLVTFLENRSNFEFISGLKSRKAAEREILRHSSLIFCTVSTAAGLQLQKANPVFDIAIIDEAAQLVEADTMIVMNKPGLKQLVLVGDQHQLPATVISTVAKDRGYDRSLFQRLHMLKHPSDMLNTQYRMHPSISKFPNHQFYHGELQDGPNVSTISYNKMPRPYLFVHVNGPESNNDTHSKKNLSEVAVVLCILQKLCRVGGKHIEVGIISPYSGQVRAINERVRGMQLHSVQLQVKSVDGFQGREMDVILLSTVRSNPMGSIGFLNDYRRLNVAITRARYLLCIVGDANTLGAYPGIWKDVLADAKDRGCFLALGPGRENIDVAT